jgi:hypothetical protein
MVIARQTFNSLRIPLWRRGIRGLVNITSGKKHWDPVVQRIWSSYPGQVWSMTTPITYCRLVRGYRVHLDRPGPAVQRASDPYLFPRELFQRLLVAKCVGIPSVIQDIQGTMRVDTGNGALGVCRSHTHSRMIGFPAHAIRNGARERLPALCSGHCRDDQKTKDQRFQLTARCHEMSS